MPPEENAPRAFTTAAIRPADRPEHVACSAIWFDDHQKHAGQPRNIETGFVVCGLRHNNCWSAKHTLSGGLGPSEVRGPTGETINISTTEGYSRPIQGFVTSHHRFLTREAAAAVAFEAGQIPAWEPGDSLASEELY